METTSMPRDQEFEIFLSYWRELQMAEAPVPRRASFNPMRLKALLPFVYLLELRGPDELHVRLSGTALDGASGLPMTGYNFLELCAPEERNFYHDLAAAICSHPCGARMMRHANFRDGSVYHLREMGLPLADKDGVVRYIIGLMSIRADFETGAPKDATFNTSHLQNLMFIDLGAGIPATMPALPH